jgi:hypothetical protein
MIVNVECSKCHAVQPVNTDLGSGVCNCCGYKLFEQQVRGSYEKAYRKQRNYKIKNRVIFIILELLSLLFTIAFCRIFAFVLDTQVFVENNWLIFAVWIIIAYSIYHKFEYKIR